MRRAKTYRCTVIVDIPPFLGMSASHSRNITQMLLAQFRQAVFKAVDAFCVGKLAVMDGEEPIAVTLVKNMRVEVQELNE